jgi:DNA-directed RNA polymerase specialized sigma24 family protein
MYGIKNYKQIIIDLQKEDEKVFAEFLSSHFVLVYHYVKNYINDVRLSLDLTMEVFLKLYYKVLDYEYSSDFDFITWMFNVAKFTVEDKLKDNFSLKAKNAKISAMINIFLRMLFKQPIIFPPNKIKIQ